MASQFNFNFKILFLVLILISACCLLSIGYNFKITKLFDMGDISFWASLTLILFLFYVLYEFFKVDTCEDLALQGSQRFGNAINRGVNYMQQPFYGQPGTGQQVPGQPVTVPGTGQPV
jgi:hypothetical protein